MESNKCDSKCVDNLNPNKIVIPTLPTKDMLEGEIFGDLQESIYNIIVNKTNPELLKVNINRFCKILGSCMGVSLTMSIIDESIAHTKFFGVNIYPGINCIKSMLNPIAERDIRKTVNIWKTTKEWHIEIDGRLLYDKSLHLSSSEATILIIQAFDNTVLQYNAVNRVSEIIINSIDKMDYINARIAQAKSVRFVWSIPILYACTALGYKTTDKITNNEAIVMTSPIALHHYNTALVKVLTRYGQDGIINESDFELERKIMCVMQWIFEGIDCLKNTAIKFVHHLETQYKVCYSPYIRKIIKAILIRFISIQGKLDYMKLVTEGTGIAVKTLPYNPNKEKLSISLVNEHWKHICAVIENSIPSEYIDKNGFCRKVSQEEIDMCVVELDNIQDPEDKIYLLERLYKIIGNIEVALDMLSDPKQARKVRQSKSELLNLKSYAFDVRMRILSFKFRPETYGLFIKYPKGYEG